MKTKKLIAATLVTLILSVSGMVIYTTQASDQPPTLEVKPGYQGYLKSKKKDFKCLLEFSQQDHKKWEKHDKKNLRAFKFTSKNGGVNTVFFEKETTAKEIIEGMNPTAKVVAIALYDAAADKFQMTEQCAYKEDNIIKKDPKDIVIPAGQAALLIIGGNTEIANARDGKYQTDYVYKPCEQKSAGWYNYAMTKNGPNLAECVDSVGNFFVQTNDNPIEWKELSSKSAIKDYKPSDYYLAWVYFKEKPKKTVVTQGQNPPAELNVTSEGTTLKINWKAPTEAKDLLGYDLLIKKGSSTEVSTTLIHTVTSYELKNVVEGTTYNVSLGAKYDSGSKSIEKAYTVSTKATQSLLKPTEVVGKETGGTLAFTWKKPSDANPKHYKYNLYKNGVLYDGPSTTTSTGAGFLPSITADSVFKLKVIAVYESGESEAVDSNEVILKMPTATTFSPVTNVLGKVSSQGTKKTLDFDWKIPTTGSPKGYEYTLYKGSEIIVGPIVATNTTGMVFFESEKLTMTGGEKYKLKVAVVYEAGKSAAAESNEITIVASASIELKAPTEVKGTQKAGSIYFEWKKPEGVIPKTYEIEIYKNGEKVAGPINHNQLGIEIAASSTYSLNGGEKYKVKVVAVYETGKSTPADSTELIITAAAQTYNPPSALTLAQGDVLTELTASWTKPQPSEGLLNYELSIWQDEPITDLVIKKETISKDATSSFLTNLINPLPGTTYYFTLKANYANGSSKEVESNSKSIPAISASSKELDDFTVNHIDNYVDIDWAKPQAEVLFYLVYYKKESDAGFTMLSSEKSNNPYYEVSIDNSDAQVYNLEPGKYKFQVMAKYKDLSVTTVESSEYITVSGIFNFATTITPWPEKQTTQVNLKWEMKEEFSDFNIYHKAPNGDFVLEDKEVFPAIAPAGNNPNYKYITTGYFMFDKDDNGVHAFKVKLVKDGKEVAESISKELTISL